MNTRVRVLHVDDDPEFAELAATFLERESDQFSIDTTSDETEGLERLAEAEYDCVVADYDMSEMSGIEFLETVRETYPDLPFILFTGKGSEAVASEAISAGVTDYLQKGGGREQYTLLANRIRNAVEADRTARAAEFRKQLMRHVEVVGGTGGWEFDVDGSTFRWTVGTRRMLGVPEGQEPDSLDEALEYYHPDDRAAVRETFERVRETRDPASGEWRVRTAQGDERLVEVTMHPVVVDDTVVALRGAIHDITDQRERERELESERTFVEQALNALDEAFYVAGTDGELRRWNDTVRSVTGYSDDELADMSVTDFFSGSDRERIARAVEEVPGSDRVTVDAELVTADGERLPHTFTASSLTDVDDEHDGFVGVGRNRSDGEPSQFDLELSEMAFAHAGTPLFLVSVADATEFTVERVNPACADLTGRDPDAVRGESPAALFDDGSGATVEAQCRNCIEQQTTVEYETRGSVGGERRLLETRLEPVVRRGTVVAIVGEVRDATGREDRERDLARYERLVENLPVGVFRATADGEFVSANEALLSTYGAKSKAALRTAGEATVYADDTHRELVLEQLAETDTIENKLLRVESLDGEQKWVEASLSMSLEDGDRYIDGIVREPTESSRQAQPLDAFEPPSTPASDTLSVVDVEENRLVGTMETDGSGQHQQSIDEFLGRLYELATDTEMAFEEKVDRLVGRARHHLDCDIGFLTRIDRDDTSGLGVQTVVEAVGDHDALQPGMSCRLSEAYCRKTLESDGLLSIADAPDAGLEDDPAYERFDLGSYIGGTVVVDDEVYGTVCFASEEPRQEPFDPLERTVVRLLSWWVSYELENERLSERFEQFAEAVPDALFLAASDYSELHYANSAAESLYGVDEQRLRADPTSWAHNLHPGDGDALDEMIPASGGVTEPRQRELRIEHPERGTRWVEVGLYPVDAGGETDRIAGVARDVTEGVQRRQRLETFASAVSHDLRNPLSAAVGYLDLARRECDSEYLDDVQRSHERMETLIENLLALARDGEQVSQPEPVDLGDLCEQCWHTVDTDEARLVVETDRVVCADPSRLQQLFENLYRNAVEHGGDAVTVTVGDLENGFYVSDDGSGIPADDRERLFEMGQAPGGGTGFGLSIVEQVADAHGWTVRVTDGPDGGARFEVTGIDQPDA